MQNPITKNNALEKEGLNLMYYIIVVLLINALFVVYFLTLSPKVEVEGKGSDGECKMLAQRTYEITSEGVKDFARLSIIKINNYDYLNYRDNLKSAAQLFTPRAQSLFLRSMNKSVEDVIKNRITVKAIMTNEVQIEKVGVSLDGFKFWVVNIPIEIQFHEDINGKAYASQRQKVSLEITQDEPTKANPYGLAITSLKLL